MARKLKRILAIDPRSLAAFRIAAGVILLVDVSIRASDFAAHYTESGILPLEALSEWLGPSSWRWSLYTLLPASWWPAALLGLTAVCGGLLILGLATRLATAAAWLLAVSLHNRMPVNINAGDTLLHVLLFWGIFLPLGTRWSVDAALRRRRGTLNGNGEDQVVFSPASSAILIQVGLLYVCSGIFKLGNQDWQAGMSLYYVMSYDAYARPAAGWLLDHANLLKLLTWATVVLEIAGPLVAFCPWKTGLMRVLVVGSFAAFHMGIEATMTVGLFSWVSLAGWLLFLPPGFWNILSTARASGGSEGAMEQCGNGGIAKAASSTPPVAPCLHSFIPAFLLGTSARRCISCLVLALFALTLYWNFSGFSKAAKKWRPAWCRPVLELTGLRQEWRMFTRPPRHDGWPRVAAYLTDGSEWDLLAGKPGFDWRRLDLPSAMAPNHRWRKYYSNLLAPRNESLRPYFCRFLARRFEEHHAQRLATVSLYEVEEITGAPGEETQLVRRLLHQETIRTQGAFLDAAAEIERKESEIHPGI